MADHTALKDILTRALPQESWKITLLAEWPTIVGSLAQRVSIEKIQGTTLVLGVQSASWMHELYLLSSVLVKTINTHLRAQHIQKLLFKPATARKRLQPGNSFVPSAQLSTFPVAPLSFAQKQALSTIQDKELQRALRDFFNRCHFKESP